MDNTFISIIYLLAADEGLRLMPYRCSAGKLTIGYGTTFPLS